MRRDDATPTAPWPDRAPAGGGSWRAWHQPPGWLLALALVAGVVLGVWAGMTWPLLGGLGSNPFGPASGPPPTTPATTQGGEDQTTRTEPPETSPPTSPPTTAPPTTTRPPTTTAPPTTRPPTTTSPPDSTEEDEDGDSDPTTTAAGEDAVAVGAEGSTPGAGQPR